MLHLCASSITCRARPGCPEAILVGFPPRGPLSWDSCGISLRSSYRQPVTAGHLPLEIRLCRGIAADAGICPHPSAPSGVPTQGNALGTHTWQGRGRRSHPPPIRVTRLPPAPVLCRGGRYTAALLRRAGTAVACGGGAAAGVPAARYRLIRTAPITRPRFRPLPLAAVCPPHIPQREIACGSSHIAQPSPGPSSPCTTLCAGDTRERAYMLLGVLPNSLQCSSIHRSRFLISRSLLRLIIQKGSTLAAPLHAVALLRVLLDRACGSSTTGIPQRCSHSPLPVMIWFP